MIFMVPVGSDTGTFVPDNSAIVAKRSETVMEKRAALVTIGTDPISKYYLCQGGLQSLVPDATCVNVVC